MLHVYFGHHKCASTWIREIIAKVCREAGLRHKLILDPKTPSDTGPLTDYSSTFDRWELGSYLQRHEVDFASCVTADRGHVDGLNVLFRGFHVIRDPRDIVVSAYFSHKNSHPVTGLPHLAAHRERLQSVSKSEGLLLEMEFSKTELLALRDWNYDQPNVLEVKMEDLTAHPYETFLDIFTFLDLMDWNGQPKMRQKARTFLLTSLNRFGARSPWLAPLRCPIRVTGDMLLGRVYDNRFEKKTGGRDVGKADKQSHYRKGKAGDWRNHFTPEHVERFKEAFGDILIQTGYEAHYDWGLSVQEAAAS